MKSLVVVGVVAVLGAGGVQAASAYKCKQPNGTWLFSDEPCGKNAEKFELELAPSIGHIPVPESAGPSLAAGEPGGPPPYLPPPPPPESDESGPPLSDLELENLARRRHVAVGMSAAQVREAWGDPLNVRHKIHEFGVTEVWSYDAGGTVQKTVILLNNRVISVDINR